MSAPLVTCYVNPDLDGTAGATAYAEYLNKTGVMATVGIIGRLDAETQYVFKRFRLEYPDQIFSTANFHEIILVDASDLGGLEGQVDPAKVIEIIDHRKINEAHKFPNAKAQIELVGAAATLIAEKFIQNNIPISLKSATLLLSAIISNTLNFKSGTTTERDRAAFEWLNTVAKLSKSYWKELFLTKSDLSGDKLAEKIINDFAQFTFGNSKVGIAQIEMIGGKKLVTNRKQEILDLLQKIKYEKNLDYIFLNLIELETDYNFFITSDLGTQNLLEKIFTLKFSTNCTEKYGLIMRKQITPLIKTEIEKK